MQLSINQGDIPVCRVNEHCRFNRTEILEWATAHGIAIPHARNSGFKSVLAARLLPAGLMDVLTRAECEIATNAEPLN